MGAKSPVAGGGGWPCFTVLVGLVLLAAYGEVDLGNLSRHLSGLTSYFGRILPKLSYANFAGDVGEWYWNFFGW